MKKLKKILALALCAVTVGCFSSCLNGNDSSSTSSTSDSSAVMRKVTKEEWEAAFDALRMTNNVTYYTEILQVDDNLKPVEYVKLTMKVADGNKTYGLFNKIDYSYPPESPNFNQISESYAARIDGVDYAYGKTQTSEEWIRQECQVQVWYTLESNDFTFYKDVYEEMSYDETTGIYRLENKLIDADPIAYMLYYATVEFRDGKIYRLVSEIDGDYVESRNEKGEVVWKLQGRSTATVTYYDYGTTEITLPEVEE